MSENTKGSGEGIILKIILLLMLPILLTQTTIEDRGAFLLESTDPTPYGYTVSLLIFIIPVCAMMFWWFGQERRMMRIRKKAFWITVLLLTIAGVLMDVLFAKAFFTFENVGADLDIYIPGLNFDTWSFTLDIPIEEVLFYLTGSLVILLGYIWSDEVWLREYKVKDFAERVQASRGMLGVHWGMVRWSIGLIIVAALYKQYGVHDYHEGWPAYFTVQVIGYFTPIILLLGAHKDHINWRALYFTTSTLVLVSIVYEANLGVPYKWWGYQHERMMGIFVGHIGLPIEAIFFWFVAGWAEILVFLAIEAHFHKGGSVKESFLGPS